MRQRRFTLSMMVGATLLAFAPMACFSEGAKQGDKSTEKPFAKYKARIENKSKQFDMTKPAQREELLQALAAGRVEELEGEAEIENPLKIKYELAIWAIVIFAVLLFVLRKMAWTPMLEGLQKREESIKSSVEEAKRARADTERISQEFKIKMDQAYAEIPKIMDQARRDAEAFKEETRAQTTKEVQAERQRLRREIETARDQALQELWNQAAQLATLISAKAIGRSLTADDHRRLLDEAIGELGQSANHG